MNRSRHLLGLLKAAAGILLLSAATGVMAQGAERKDLALRGDAKCTRCHDASEEVPVLAIAQTRHGMKGDSRTPSCTSCHGESERHVNRPPDAKERPKPDVMFGKSLAKSDAHAQNGSCESCHESSKRMHWKGSAHESNDVTCASCHTVHAVKDKVLSKSTQTEVCYACHKQQRSQMQRISHHPVPEGKMACSSCHNPHGGAGPANLVNATVNETCYSCHAEKRGPFLIEHPPAREDCSNCHTPHGSNHAPLLKARQPWLCQECHLAPQHPSTAYSGTGVPPVGAAQQVLGKSCSNCHQQVHGSNHPSGWRWTR
jgi:DmsE family decaheme c-type cytochrome